MPIAWDPLIGIGLRAPHYQYVLEKHPSIGWLEVHSENFFSEGGSTLNTLCHISERYLLSLHGVGTSLGSAEGVSLSHLKRLSRLIHLVQPLFISEHLSWGSVNGIYLPDLLPIPYTEESLAIFSRNVMMTQDLLNREIFIENPSSYIEYTHSQKTEVAFLVALCQQTGAKILLDINNLFVSSSNHGWDPLQYIDALPRDLVKEIHLAGHSTKTLPSKEILRIDTHNTPVCQEVWALYAHAIQRFGPLPTLLEWDTHIPSFEFLIKEASKARIYLSSEKEALHA